MTTKNIRLTLFLFLALGLGLVNAYGINAQGQNRAGLVVQFGDGSTLTRCVSFNEQSISGYDVLERSGFSVISAFDPSMGALVCKIENDGCSVNNCLCENPPDYWAYWHLDGNSWVYSPAGVSAYMVQNGGVEGWSWGPGNPPPVIPFEQICADTPSETPTITNTLIPPTNTPAPSETFTHTPTTEPQTDTPIPPTSTTSSSDSSQQPTATSVPPTHIPTPTFTPLGSQTPTQTPTADNPYPAESQELTATLTPTQEQPYPPPQSEPSETLPLATQPPSQPYPPYPEPTEILVYSTPTSTPADTATAVPLKDTPSQAAIPWQNMWKYLLCGLWVVCGGSMTILIAGWIFIFIQNLRE